MLDTFRKVPFKNNLPFKIIAFIKIILKEEKNVNVYAHKKFFGLFVQKKFEYLT